MWRNSEDRKKKLLQTLDANIGKYMIMFDTETTGLKKDDQIVELAGKKYRIEKDANSIYEFLETDTFHAYIKPPFAMDSGVIAIHGITNEFLEDKFTEEEISPQIAAFFGDADLLCAYNINFDIKMLMRLYERTGMPIPFVLSEEEKQLDVLIYARDLVSSKETKSHKQEDVCKAMGLEDGVKFHSAIDDIEACFRLFKIFVKQYQDMETLDYSKLPTPMIYQNGIAYWEKGKIKRIYVNTDKGGFYYDIIKKEWNVKDASDSMKNYNVPALIKAAFQAVCVSDEEAFVKAVRKDLN